MRKLTILMTFLLFVAFQAAAQMQITGKVTNAETGEPIPGVSVVVKGQTTIGTTTDMDGNYTLSGVPSDAETLVYSFVGMETKEVDINGRTTIDVQMAPEVKEMEEVVVTALGISREKKSLGYSVQDVGSEELEKAPTTNMLNNLSGKVAGVQITSASGAVGSSTRITIRGNSSFSDNQPLFVVDGTPISNFSSSVSQFGAADFGNASMDIDPSNIESISILKGANAAAIYGSRAANGVVLIKTKGGKEREGIGVSYSYANDYSNPYILPDYQNKYGQGTIGSEYQAKLHGVDFTNLDAYNEYAVNNSYSYYNGIGGGVNDYYDESWGPRLDIGLMIPQFTSPWVDENGNVTTDPTQFAGYQPTEWVSHPNNTENFFRTGISNRHNLALTAGGEVAQGRLSLGRESNQGTVPNTDLTKTNIDLSGTINLSDKVTARFKGSFVNNFSNNIPYGGYDARNIMQSIGGWFGRQVDMEYLQEHWRELDPFGKPVTWSYYYHDNPYWTVHRKPTSRNRDRVFGNAEIQYNVLDWVSLTARVGTDLFNEKRKHRKWEMSNSNKTNGGDFWQQKFKNQETNIDFIANFDKQINPDIRVDGVLGTKYRRYDYDYSFIQASELTVPNFFHISNVRGNPTTDMSKQELEMNSVFGQVNFSYQDFLFLGGTARNDWSSTLPSDNWSYFYPSVNFGLVFSELFDSGILSFGKVRASYAVVGNDTDPYQLSNVFVASGNTFKGVSQYFYNRGLANANLKPENKNSFEAGLNLKFMNNRFGIDFTYYDEKTTDQIMQADIAASTGFTSQWINAGEIENEGIELNAYADIFKSRTGFNWSINVNWGKNENTVNELAEGIDVYQINSSWGGVTTEARPGEPLGVIRAGGYLRDEDNNIIVNSSGIPKPTDSPINVGNFTPDWTGGVVNNFSYKGFNLSVSIDGRKGGDIFSVTKMFGLYAGVLEQTAAGETRKNGVIAGQNALTEYDFVKEDGTPNDIRVSAMDFWKQFYTIKEEAVIDGSYIKLREISLGYTIPQKYVKMTGFLTNLRVSAYARNVALLYTHHTNDVPIDPETGFGATIGGRGLEQFQIPPNRTIGFKIATKF